MEKVKTYFTKIKDTVFGTYRFISDAIEEVFDWAVNSIRENIEIVVNLFKRIKDDQRRYFLSSKLLEANWFTDLLKAGPDLECNRVKKPQVFHKYHILDPSPWPFMVPFGVVTMMIGFVIYVHVETDELEADATFLWLGMLQTLICSFLWWDDVVYESEEHTEEVRKGLKIGMLLFIVSEVMFFFSFFWAFFHLSLSPSIEIGSIWPPIELGEFLVNPYKIPLANTIILLSSGVTITYVHHQLNWVTVWAKSSFFLIKLRLFLVNIKQSINEKKTKNSLGDRYKTFFKDLTKMNNLKKINISALCFLINKLGKKDDVVSEITIVSLMEQRERARGEGKQLLLKWSIKSYIKYLKEHFSVLTVFSAMKEDYLEFLGYTLILAVAFTIFQIGEYMTCEINLSDGVYGSTFYLLTGFHGFHVIIGSIFIFVCFLRAFYGQFEDGKYIGLECAIWYWHFVDVVWLFLYIFVYIWSSTVRVVGINPQLGSEMEIAEWSVISNLVENEGKDKGESDFADYGQIFFQDPASFVMENIISLHNYVMIFLIVIFSVVIWFFFTILSRYTQKEGNKELYFYIKMIGGSNEENTKTDNNYFGYLVKKEVLGGDDLVLKYDNKGAKELVNKKKVESNKKI